MLNLLKCLKLSNVWNAPKSTALALVLFVFLLAALWFQKLENEVALAILALLGGVLFTDPLKENKLNG
jgi:hypothetical protein